MYVHSAWKGRPQNDLYCVGRDVKPYSLIHCVFVCFDSEQRVTGILVYIMVGLSALLAKLLQVLRNSCVFSACA